MPAETDSRLTKLEVLAAEQEQTITDLSAEIVKAWTTIETLDRRVEQMALRLTGIEEATAPDTPITKPPHW